MFISLVPSEACCMAVVTACPNWGAPSQGQEYFQRRASGPLLSDTMGVRLDQRLAAKFRQRCTKSARLYKYIQLWYIDTQITVYGGTWAIWYIDNCSLLYQCICWWILVDYEFWAQRSPGTMGAWQKCCWNQATARWQAVTSTYWICHQKQASDQYKNYGERWWINGESMVNQWWINGESMVNQWWINGESMMNQWWISGKSMVNQWWIVVNNGILMVNTLVNTLVGALEHEWIMTFHSVGNFIIPTDFDIFHRGWNHQPVVISTKKISAWWFQTWILFSIIYEIILPIDELIFFQDG